MAGVEVLSGAENGAKAAPAVAFSAFKPQLVVEASLAADAVQFYKNAFGAEEVSRTSHSKRKADQELPLVLSADLKLGSSVFSVSGAAENSAVQSGTGCVFCLETEDIEAAISKAVSAGAVVVPDGEAVEGESACGGRAGIVKDPYGFVWTICTVAKACSAAVEV